MSSRTSARSLTSLHRTNPDGRRSAALITGASSGIGRALSHELAGHGHDVVLVARSTDRLQELASELMERYRVNATVIAADLARAEAPESIYTDVQSRGLTIEILINNAGFNVYGQFADTDLATESCMVQVNVVAVVALTKLFMRDMVERGSGRILNVASTAAFSPAPFDSVYAASKAFVLSFSEALAEELKGTGVTATALCPGPTATEFAARAGMLDTRIFKGRLLTAQQVASIGYAAAMRGQPTVVTGLANRLLVLSIRLSSRALVTRIARGLLSKVPASASSSSAA